MNRFPYQSNEYLGILDSNPIQFSNFLKQNIYENDIYKFNITGTRNINLSLNNISVGDDADLYLYRDSNGNGILDNGDILVQSSIAPGSGDDTINLGAQPGGTYFARVRYFSSGINSRIDYDLGLSAQYSGPSNVIGVDVYLANFNNDLNHHGWIGSSNTIDTYQFNLNLDFSEGLNINLFGLSADANIRLIQDSNNDGVVQTSEIIAFSTNKGNSNESILEIDIPGTYLLQVYQYSGNTYYTVNFDTYL